MNLSAAKAFNGFILEAKNAFDRVFNREVTEEELEQIKVTYSGTEFERYKKEFDKELLANFKEYNDESLLHDYIHETLAQVKGISFLFDVNAIIIRNEWETGFLLNLKRDIESQVKLIELFYDFNRDFEYEELMYYCQRLESIEKSVDEQDKLISLANIPPAKDNRFEFDLLRQECESLENYTERIKIITARQYEFEQWKIQNEKVDPEWGFFTTKYNELYYPNFEKLCKIEIEKLQKTAAIEKSVQAVITPVKQAEEVKQLSTPDYVWKSSATDLLELVTALYQNKSIERKDGKPLTRKELIAHFEQMFNIVIADTEGKLYKATNRKINQTPFLDSLAVQFENYAEGKEAKMLKRR